MGLENIHPKMGPARLGKDLLDHSELSATILGLAGDAIISVDRQQSIILFNRGAEKMFGYTAEDVGGKSLKLLLPAGLTDVFREHIETLSDSRAAARRMRDRREVTGRRKDGSEFPAEASLSIIKFKGRIILTLIMQDVSRRLLAEERLRTTLREKEVLLEEVQHRVKNNLQVITSLLGLQARSIKDPAIRKKFEESRYRIQAMAVLHEILYESVSLDEIDFADYIRRLAEHLVRSYGASGRIRMQVRLDPLYCHRDVASPCGLIVNELLSNAFKYAFPGGNSGEVRIELRREPEGTIHLLVGDDGIGLPRGLDWEKSPTLGLRLVRTLARQIEARVETIGNQGTVFSMKFQDGLSI
jgi:PAS domain S-box-containing protein